MKIAWALGLLCCLGTARAQTMLDQEQRLIEVHALLLALPPTSPPGSHDAWHGSVALELIGIPTIDGTTGSKKQLTASDRTPVLPRPRVALGLPAPEGFRAFVGLAYIPPVTVRDVSSHLFAVDAGLAWTPGALAIGLRGQLQRARSKSPVTDPATRDTLDTFEFGGDLSAGYRFDFDPGTVTPYASLGLLRVEGDFRVFSDGYLLTSRTTNPVLTAGVRLFSRRHFETVAGLAVYPGRLIHPSLRVAWVP